MVLDIANKNKEFLNKETYEFIFSLQLDLFYDGNYDDDNYGECFSIHNPKEINKYISFNKLIAWYKQRKINKEFDIQPNKDIHTTIHNISKTSEDTMSIQIIIKSNCKVSKTDFKFITDMIEQIDDDSNYPIKIKKNSEFKREALVGSKLISYKRIDNPSEIPKNIVKDRERILDKVLEDLEHFNFKDTMSDADSIATDDSILQNYKDQISEHIKSKYLQYKQLPIANTKSKSGKKPVLLLNYSGWHIFLQDKEIKEKLKNEMNCNDKWDSITEKKRMSEEWKKTDQNKYKAKAIEQNKINLQNWINYYADIDIKPMEVLKLLKSEENINKINKKSELYHLIGITRNTNKIDQATKISVLREILVQYFRKKFTFNRSREETSLIKQDQKRKLGVYDGPQQQYGKLQDDYDYDDDDNYDDDDDNYDDDVKSQK
tara:strand:+ start:4069 stop:5364 length:1296 start_codon:yes stop_codon:yes gene_type:complete